MATKDGHLITRHEPNIIEHHRRGEPTPQFAARRRTAVVDGAATEEGFFASDFTLAEIKHAAREAAVRGPPRSSSAASSRIAHARGSGRTRQAQGPASGPFTMGVYIETKHPTYHQKLGLPLEQRILQRADRRAGWNYREAPLFIQSFEQAKPEAAPTR